MLRILKNDNIYYETSDGSTSYKTRRANEKIIFTNLWVSLETVLILETPYNGLPVVFKT